MKPLLEKLTLYSICLVPATATWLSHGVSGFTGLLLLIALLGLAYERQMPRLHDWEKVLLLILLLMPLYSLLSWWLTGMAEEGVKHISKQLRFALFVPVYLWMRRCDLGGELLWAGIIAGAILSLPAALYDVLVLDLPRARGVHHPIIFGDIALMLGVMSLAYIPLARRRGWRFGSLLPLFAFVCGIVASVLSASRGAWIALPALAILLLLLYWRDIGRGLRWGVLVLMVLVPLLSYLVPQTGVKHRVQEAVNEVSMYLEGGHYETSLGLRFEAWRVALETVRHEPLFGVGIGNYKKQARDMIETGKVRAGADMFSHTHNDYLSQAATTGLLGLGLLLSLYLYPAWRFLRALPSASPGTRAQAVAGLVLVVAFMHFSMSETLMVRSTSVSIYGAMLLMFCWKIAKSGERT